jgi:hypothetical protein
MSKYKGKIILMGFIIIISSVISAAFFTNEDLIIAAFMVAVGGVIISLYPFIINTNPIKSKENLEMAVLQSKTIAQSMPDVNPPDRPVLINRELPNFSFNVVRQYVNSLAF